MVDAPQHSLDESAELQPKVGRGRPHKTSDEKSTYSHLILSERVINSLDAPTSQSTTEPLSEEQERQQVLAKLKEIKQLPASNAYYWKLVFTFTFHLYRESQEVQHNRLTSGEPVRTISVKQMAQAAGLEYHNLKNLFIGRGTVRNLTDYQSFLYEHGIDFMQVQYNPRLVDKAYFYLICLKQTNLDKESLTQLFF
ncbi:hypothetical protein M0L20_25070 [Spirosoma sp. RP8]|uniref:Uncharacterized protein n=1 Tax=Spirosoma liriopis TaxID=2937440 RepID=A0ABT0HSK7_9BACT|nr:hypothetical protein [Spirosoma liriopis]MCK8495168.1 hypothetical protein [Spirosoma liriopis]